MTGWRKRQVSEMAREAGLRDWTCNGKYGCLEAFAELVRADERNRTWTQEHWTEYERSIVEVEREACWNIIFEYAGRDDITLEDESLLKHLADLIRARGEQA